MSPVVSVNSDLRQELKDRAARFRDRMTSQGTLVVNLVSSPGAGKTSLLQQSAKELSSNHRLAVLVGDLATNRDAERLAQTMPAEQLTTGGACHLEIPLVEAGFVRLSEQTPDILFIENVGNLVCPASHDLGEHLRVVLLSTTEGEDKPGKYPKMYRTSDALILTKMDLLPYVPFDVEFAIADAHAVQPQLKIFQTSATKGEGISQWCEYLRQLCQQLKSGNLPSHVR
ncbi:MAG: hydrogenase nickel incorporation protein HypB [Planctomycetaceae bacterium]|nr:hydrogenase nickel incorporation protein HypB [Planctomycetaceae bacterium]